MNPGRQGGGQLDSICYKYFYVLREKKKINAMFFKGSFFPKSNLLVAKMFLRNTEIQMKCFKNCFFDMRMRDTLVAEINVVEVCVSHSTSLHFFSHCILKSENARMWLVENILHLHLFLHIRCLSLILSLSFTHHKMSFTKCDVRYRRDA